MEGRAASWAARSSPAPHGAAPARRYRERRPIRRPSALDLTIEAVGYAGSGVAARAGGLALGFRGLLSRGQLRRWRQPALRHRARAGPSSVLRARARRRSTGSWACALNCRGDTEGPKARRGWPPLVSILITPASASLRTHHFDLFRAGVRLGGSSSRRSSSPCGAASRCRRCRLWLRDARLARATRRWRPSATRGAWRLSAPVAEWIAQGTRSETGPSGMRTPPVAPRP